MSNSFIRVCSNVGMQGERFGLTPTFPGNIPFVPVIIKGVTLPSSAIVYVDR
jgi:hypothetical protein